jgi:hypothetical protein
MFASRRIHMVYRSSRQRIRRNSYTAKPNGGSGNQPTIKVAERPSTLSSSTAPANKGRTNPNKFGGKAPMGETARDISEADTVAETGEISFEAAIDSCLGKEKYGGITDYSQRYERARELAKKAGMSWGEFEEIVNSATQKHIDNGNYVAATGLALGRLAEFPSKS